MYRTPKVFTGIITRKTNYGESDLIITLLTYEYGKIEVIAKYGRKSKKRFEAGLSTYLIYTGVFNQNKNSGLSILKELNLKTSYPNILNNFENISCAAYGTELIREFSPLNQPEPFLFYLLTNFYEALNRGKEIPSLILWIEYNTLNESGYIPILSHCQNCLKTAHSKKWFFTNSGILCENCNNKHLSFLYDEDIKWLLSLDDVFSIESLPPESKSRIIPIFYNLISNVLEKKLKSRELLGIL
jgi:DNA repair protein RecO (recombination protein O)